MSGSKLARKRSVPLAAGLIVLAALAAYHGIFRLPFVFDDFNAVTLNPTIRHLWPPWEALRTPRGTGSETDGRPLANLSLAINYAISGTDPWSYHALALLLHVLAARAPFGVLGGPRAGAPARPRARRSLGEGGPDQSHATFGAFAIVLLWTVHPLQTETVTNVAHRTELLVSLFYLLTLYGFIRYALRQSSFVPPGGTAADEEAGGKAWAWLATLCCLLGMLSKEVMVSAPLVVLLYDRTFVAGSFADAWRRRRGLHLALAGTWSALVVLRIISPARGGTGGFGLGISPWDYALTQCRAIVLYLKLSFWPHPLVLDYGNGLVRQAGEVWPQGLLLLALLAATAAALWRKPALGFAGACFFAILGPSSSFLPLVTQTIAEHRMYLPLAAVLALAVCGLEAAVGAEGRRLRRRCCAAVLVMAALALGFATGRRNRDYRSAVAIWSDTVAKVPGNPRAHDNLGNALLEAQRRPEAIAAYEAALRIDPHDTQAHYNLGGAFLDAGQLPAAIDQYKAALRSTPSFDRAHDNLGTALLRAGRLSEAIEQFAEAVRVNPAHVPAHYNLANALVQRGQIDAAILEYQATVRLAPDMADAHFNLATALSQVGRTREAIAQYRIVLQLHPADTEAASNLARLERP